MIFFTKKKLLLFFFYLSLLIFVNLYFLSHSLVHPVQSPLQFYYNYSSTFIHSQYTLTSTSFPTIHHSFPSLAISPSTLRHYPTQKNHYPSQKTHQRRFILTVSSNDRGQRVREGQVEPKLAPGIRAVVPENDPTELHWS